MIHWRKTVQITFIRNLTKLVWCDVCEIRLALISRWIQDQMKLLIEL